MNHSLDAVCSHTAVALKKLSDFDRVMIYRFDEGWNGEVVAEAKRPDLQEFLHLRYPASDIPSPARDLFFRNQSRMIVDVQAEAVPILTRTLSLKSLDLSLTNYRAVSPIHLQYLENMGVQASFAAPIKIEASFGALSLAITIRVPDISTMN